jgi:hypothetical protein
VVGVRRESVPGGGAPGARTPRDRSHTRECRAVAAPRQRCGARMRERVRVLGFCFRAR